MGCGYPARGARRVFPCLRPLLSDVVREGSRIPQTLEIEVVCPPRFVPRLGHSLEPGEVDVRRRAAQFEHGPILPTATTGGQDPRSKWGSIASALASVRSWPRSLGYWA